MDAMQTDLRSSSFVPTTTGVYPQLDNFNNQEIVIIPLQSYTLTHMQQLPLKKASPSFVVSHLRTLVSLGLLAMVAISLIGASTLGGDTALRHFIQSITLFSQSQPVGQNISLATHSSPLADASQQLTRISQLDPNQYASNAEYSTWAYSACSTAAMTEVFNAYGNHYRITDVLSIESQIGAITPYLGLVDPSGIASTATKFGFKTQWGNDGSIDQIINIANSGKPVIVGFPPDRYDGGHLLVVVGGNNDSVFLADTSLWNRRELSRSQFLTWWGGFYAVVTPNN